MLKVGDKVRITDNKSGHNYKIGQAITVKKFCIGDDFLGLEESSGVKRYVNYKGKNKECELIEESKPDHYKTTSIDVIDIARLYDLNFCMANIVKYACRKKGQDKDDLKKIIDYAQRELKHLDSLDN